jgi:hypothetical protein
MPPFKKEVWVKVREITWAPKGVYKKKWAQKKIWVKVRETTWAPKGV